MNYLISLGLASGCRPPIRSHGKRPRQNLLLQSLNDNVESTHQIPTILEIKALKLLKFITKQKSEKSFIVLPHLIFCIFQKTPKKEVQIHWEPEAQVPLDVMLGLQRKPVCVGGVGIAVGWEKKTSVCFIYKIVLWDKALFS